MLKNLPKDRIATIGLGVLLVGGGSYAVVKGQRQPAPINFSGLPAQSGFALDSREPATKTQPVEVVVHVAGAVKGPGVFRLSSEARVEDAIRAAGGSMPNADLQNINLAARLVDGTQVFVPQKGKPDEVDGAYRGGSVVSAYSHAPGTPGRTKKEPPAQPISLNSAGETELQSLPGIGPATAQRILDYRRTHKRFRSIDELLAVKGIGDKKLTAIRKFVRL